MDSHASEQQVQLAILDFTMGDYGTALAKLDQVLQSEAGHFEAHLARTEVLYAMEHYEAARVAAEAAERIRPDDVHLKTSLSRIWMRLGDLNKAETYGAQAKMLSWKEELKQHPVKKEGEN